MIVRDEADQIAECLRSVRGLVDEMVVVDTGSTDDTPARAQEQGARVVVFPWSNDFAAARNCSIAEATGDWILVLDADERLFPRHFEAMRRLMAKHWAQAVQLFVRNYTDDANLLGWQPIDPAQPESIGFCGYVDSPQARLFRRREGVGYKGLVHETLAAKGGHVAPPVYRANVLVHHYKQSRPAGRVESRNRLILDLSRKRSETEPDDPDIWRQRAMAAMDCGERAEAVTSLERAIELGPQRRDHYFQLASILILIGQAERACEVCRQALDRFPDEPELVQSLGEALLSAGQAADAREAFARSLELDPYLYRSLLGLGAIAVQEERTEVAANYFAQAKSINPGLDIPYVNMGLLYLRMGRLDEALAELRGAFAINPKRWQSLAGIGAVLFETGHYDQSREWYLKAADAKGCGPEVFVRLCACCTALGLHDEAGKWAQAAAAADSRYGSLRSLVASPTGQ
jgi:tetratricopeptide (TPR) repeat protein